MLFNLKSAFLFGLVVVSYASPIANSEGSLISLDRRAQVPNEINCDGKKFTKQEINDAIKESKTQHGKYPEKFGNKNGKKKVFDNIPDTTQLWEEPLTNPTWTTGEPGKFRVVMNNKYVYVGVMEHTAGGGFKKC